MNNNYKYLIAIFYSLLVSCGSGGDGDSGLTAPPAPVVEGCSVEDQNQFVHEVLKGPYFWYQDILPSINYADFDSPEQTLDFLVDRDTDRFSYIADAAEFESLFNEGQYIGYGFALITEGDGTVWVRFIYDDSPAGKAGLKRGDRVLAINGETVAQIIAADDWANVFGPDELKYPLVMVIEHSAGVIETLNLNKALININTVLHHSIIDNGSELVAYLVFNSFLETSNAELADVFAQLSGTGIKKMILDLRYNGGGRVTVSRNLGSYLNAVDTNDSHLFTRLVYNDKNQDSNTSFYLQKMTNALQLDQLIVITTGNTCSASEMIINGLDPFLQVTTVGSTTCGKPVGMNGFEFCENIILPITFEVRNQSNIGEYFAGLAADCPAQDDVRFEFGNNMEPMLSEALRVSLNNSCSTTRPAQRQQSYKSTILPASLRAITGAY